MRKMKLVMLNILISCLIPTFSFATMPVIDYTNLIQLIKEYQQLKTQYDLLKQTYQNAQQRLSEAKELASDSEGHYGYGQILNSAKDLTGREWSPDNWDDALKGLAGGNPARYQQLVQEYKQNNPSVSTNVFQEGSSQDNARVYGQQVQTNQAATVTASYEFNDVNNQLANIHQISDQIESAKDDKAAIDLNTRMETEMAYLQVQILKQIALLNEQTARNASDSIQSETDGSKFNTLPN